MSRTNTPTEIDRLFAGLDFSGDDLATDEELERSLLGGLITSEGWDVARVCDEEGLTAGLFRSAAHGNLYEAIRGLMLELGKIRPGVQRRPEPPTTLTLVEHLHSRGLAEACGGLSIASRIADRAAGPSSARWIIQKLRTAHARRMLLRESRRLAEAALNMTSDVESVALKAGASIASITDREGREESMSSAAELVSAYDLDENEPEDVEYISTDIPEVDRLLGGGLAPARLTYMAARPGHCKTALKMNIAYNIAAQGHPAAMFLLEMPATRRDQRGRKRAGDFTRRLLTLASGVPIEAWRRYGRLPGRNREEDRQVLNRAKRHLAQLPLYTDDVPGITYANLFAKIRRLKTQIPELRLVTIDYIGLVKGERGQDERSVLKATSNGLVALANDLGIHIICLSQLNRDCEGTLTKRPDAHHLRQSGELEQDADHIIMTQRPCKYEEWERHTDALWIAERKGRHVEKSETVITFNAEAMWIGGAPMPDPVKGESSPPPSRGSSRTSWRHQRDDQ